MPNNMLLPETKTAHTIIEAFEVQKNEGIKEHGDLKNINVTSALTKLIQETGRFTEHYASDLFISWNGVMDILRETGRYAMPVEKETHYVAFGIRESGVDGNTFLIRRLQETTEKSGMYRYIQTHYVYRRIYVMKIEISPAHDGLRAEAKTELKDLTHAFSRIDDRDIPLIEKGEI